MANQWNILLSTPGASSKDAIFNQKEKPVIEQKRKVGIVEDEMTGMERLAVKLNDYCSKLDRQTYSINQPASLTGWREKGFTKVSHIGGEEFWKLEFYVGKKDSIIVTMRPKHVAAYAHIEIDLEKSFSMFNDLENDLNKAAGNISLQLAGIRQGKTIEREVADVINRAEEYNGGFGSW